MGANRLLKEDGNGRLYFEDGTHKLYLDDLLDLAAGSKFEFEGQPVEVKADGKGNLSVKVIEKGKEKEIMINQAALKDRRAGDIVRVEGADRLLKADADGKLYFEGSVTLLKPEQLFMAGVMNTGGTGVVKFDEKQGQYYLQVGDKKIYLDNDQVKDTGILGGDQLTIRTDKDGRLFIQKEGYKEIYFTKNQTAIGAEFFKAGDMVSFKNQDILSFAGTLVRDVLIQGFVTVALALFFDQYERKNVKDDKSGQPQLDDEGGRKQKERHDLLYTRFMFFAAAALASTTVEYLANLAAGAENKDSDVQQLAQLAAGNGDDPTKNADTAKTDIGGFRQYMSLLGLKLLNAMEGIAGYSSGNGSGPAYYYDSYYDANKDNGDGTKGGWVITAKFGFSRGEKNAFGETSGDYTPAISNLFAYTDHISEMSGWSFQAYSQMKEIRRQITKELTENNDQAEDSDKLSGSELKRQIHARYMSQLD